MTKRELIDEFYRWKKRNPSPEIRAVQLPTAAYDSLLQALLVRNMGILISGTRISGIELLENPYLPEHLGAFIGPDHCVLGLFRL